MIKEFTKKYCFLSNFYPLPTPIEFGGISYPTSEHYYQAMKSTLPHIRQTISELLTAKKAGRTLILRPGWEQVKVPVMRLGLILKFSANSQLKTQLLDTGNVRLVEGNHWHDNIWGDCYCPNCVNIVGLNCLGLLLMEVRELFQLIN